MIFSHAYYRLLLTNASGIGSLERANPGIDQGNDPGMTQAFHECAVDDARPQKIEKYISTLLPGDDLDVARC